MRKIIIGNVGIGLFTLLILLLQCSDAYAGKFSTKIKFTESLEKGRKRAKKSGKPLFVIVGNRKNRSCNKLLKTMVKNKPMACLINEFTEPVILYCRENSDLKNANKELKANVERYPTILIYSPEGKQLYEKSGYWYHPYEGIFRFKDYFKYDDKVLTELIEECQKDLDRSKKKSTDPDECAMLAALYMCKDDLESAKKVFGKDFVVNLDDTYKTAQYLKFWCHYRDKNNRIYNQDGVIEATKTIKGIGAEPREISWLAWGYAVANDYEKAVELMEKVCAQSDYEGYKETLANYKKSLEKSRKKKK